MKRAKSALTKINNFRKKEIAIDILISEEKNLIHYLK